MCTSYALSPRKALYRGSTDRRPIRQDGSRIGLGWGEVWEWGGRGSLGVGGGWMVCGGGEVRWSWVGLDEVGCDGGRLGLSLLLLHYWSTLYFSLLRTRATVPYPVAPSVRPTLRRWEMLWGQWGGLQRRREWWQRREGWWRWRRRHSRSGHR